MGDQKKTRTIKLEIYSDQFYEFLEKLYFCKTSKNPDKSSFKSIIDAICFDTETLENSLSITESEYERVEIKQVQFFTKLIESKKDSNDYFIVCKETFKEFERTFFGKFLGGLFYLLEKSRPYIGRQDHIESKMFHFNFSMFIGTTESKLNVQSYLETNKHILQILEIVSLEFLESVLHSFTDTSAGTREKIKNRNNIINKIHTVFIKEYPMIGSHVSMIITGYAASCLGLLENEAEYILKDKAVSYKQYLKNSISQALRAIN